MEEIVEVVRAVGYVQSRILYVGPRGTGWSEYKKLNPVRRTRPRLGCHEANELDDELDRLLLASE